MVNEDNILDLDNILHWSLEVIGQKGYVLEIESVIPCRFTLDIIVNDMN